MGAADLTVLQPLVAANAICAAAEAAGKLARVDALASKSGPTDALITGHAVHASRLALAISELVLRQAAMADALRAARARIQLDRTSLADSHMGPASNEIDDEDALAALADYDVVLQQIDHALESLR
jgi:hypothetical protein